MNTTNLPYVDGMQFEDVPGAYANEPYLKATCNRCGYTKTSGSNYSLQRNLLERTYLAEWAASHAAIEASGDIEAGATARPKWR